MSIWRCLMPVLSSLLHGVSMMRSNNWKIGVCCVGILLAVDAQALTPCSLEPLDRNWSYRTKVDGRNDKCWYQGEKMRDRKLLYWPKFEEEEPEFMRMPVQPTFQDAWQSLMQDLYVQPEWLDPETAIKWQR